MKTCAFCPHQATKKGEHIFDDWLNRDEAGHHIRRGYLMKSEGREDSDSLEYRSRSINITRPVVCGTCNNGWMSDLTNHAKAITEGLIRHARPTSILPLGIATIAAYTFLKAVVVDYAITLDGHKPFFQPAVRHRFKETIAIPDGTQIWIGH
jgi:hypothetical protein